MSAAVEIEVKFAVHDLAHLQQQLFQIGFHEQTPRTFERNTLYDTPTHSLRNSHSILRIREYGPKWVLTHKCLPPNHSPDERHKHRIETETDIADGPALATIFEHLGYVQSFVYEKYRTEYADPTGHCVLDETPIGIFAELEGPEPWIDDIATKLSIPHSSLSTLSYGRLFDQWRTQHNHPAQNLTFTECSPSK